MSISITIDDLDERVEYELRARAAGQGRSLEEEARRILREAVGLTCSDDVIEPQTDLVTSIREKVEAVGGFEPHELPPFEPSHKPAPLPEVAEAIRALFAPFGGQVLELPPRD